jgi:hypothetical protein
MLRTPFTQQWFICRIPVWNRRCGALRRFVGVDLGIAPSLDKGETRPGRSFSLRELIQGTLQKALCPVYGLLEPRRLLNQPLANEFPGSSDSVF